MIKNSQSTTCIEVNFFYKIVQASFSKCKFYDFFSNKQNLTLNFYIISPKTKLFYQSFASNQRQCAGNASGVQGIRTKHLGTTCIFILS